MFLFLFKIKFSTHYWRLQKSNAQQDSGHFYFKTLSNFLVTILKELVLYQFVTSAFPNILNLCTHHQLSPAPLHCRKIMRNILFLRDAVVKLQQKQIKKRSYIFSLSAFLMLWQHKGNYQSTCRSSKTSKRGERTMASMKWQLQCLQEVQLVLLFCNFAGNQWSSNKKDKSLFNTALDIAG